MLIVLFYPQNIIRIFSVRSRIHDLIAVIPDRNEYDDLFVFGDISADPPYHSIRLSMFAVLQNTACDPMIMQRLDQSQCKDPSVNVHLIALKRIMIRRQIARNDEIVLHFPGKARIAGDLLPERIIDRRARIEIHFPWLTIASRRRTHGKPYRLFYIVRVDLIF